MHQRDLVRVELWAHVNLMKISVAKCKVLKLGQGNPQCRAGWELSGLRGGLWDIGGLKMHYEPAICAQSPESQSCPDLHQKKCGQQVEGGDSSPILWSGETDIEGHGHTGAGPEYRLEDGRRAGAHLL